MDLKDKLWNMARDKQGILVLPEGCEPRIQNAAVILKKKKLASSIVLIGNKTDIQNSAASNNIDLSGINIEQPGESPYYEEYIKEFFELRKHKGITMDDSKELVKNALNWGTLMVRKGQANALVAGAVRSTAKMVKAALTIIKTKPGTKNASSFFIMEHPDKKWGMNGYFIFADCAIIPDPNTEQLVEIAMTSAASFKHLFDKDPSIALLSFSTKGSAKHKSVDKIRDAVRIIKEKAPELSIDGELQADAALVPVVADFKAPGSNVAGKANVLIFPNLDSGNISYKLVQRLAGVHAYGPFIQGIAKPVSDLSRGCSVDDIVNTSIITLAQI